MNDTSEKTEAQINIDPSVEVKENKEIETKKEETTADTITRATKQYLHQTLDTEYIAKTYLNLARDFIKSKADEATNDLEEAKKIIEEGTDDNYAKGIAKMMDAIMKVEHLSHIRVYDLLKEGMLLTLFSGFDAFTGRILEVIYKKNPVLLNTVNRKIDVSDLLTYKSIDDIREIVIRYQIEDFHRKGYIDQFKELENNFGFRTLREFREWPSFIECAQRRNLICHCNGIVSDQYLEICKSVGCNLSTDLQAGESVTLEAKYLINSARMLGKIALMLGQTLWRKLFPAELSQADSDINAIIFDYLCSEEWGSAQSFSHFALDLKMERQVDRSICIINYAISLKATGNKEDAIRILDGEDWSGSLLDFKMANEILRENYDKAAEYMEKIGEESELIDETAYYRWPIFREFRTTKQFADMFEKIYKRSFTSALTKSEEQGRIAQREP